MIRSLHRRFSSLTSPLSLISIANRRRSWVFALLVLAAATFGGYAATASPIVETSFWRQLLNSVQPSLQQTEPPQSAKKAEKQAPAAPLASLLIEDFSYTAGALLTANGWTAHNAGGTNSIAAVSPGLTYSGYTSSGVGNAVAMTITGEDVNRTFTSQTSGSVYAAFMVNVSAATTSADGDYFFHLGPSPIGTTFRARVFAKRDASNNLAFGISKGGTTAANTSYSGFTFALNTTYLLVVKYTIVTGATNDTAELFINPTPGGAEPASTLTAPDTTASDANIGAVALRQGSAATAPTLQIDGIRVANDWASAASGNPLMITAGGPLTRQQGTAAINSTIATVSDLSAGTLTVTATTIPSGISVTNIVNSGGTVTADVAADCTAALGANTVVLTVTNGTTSATNTANLTVNVQASPPTVGNYANRSVLVGNNVTVTPSAAPADNGSIASVTAAASPNTFTGSFSGNTATGALTITNAAPAGTYTVTVTVTDNCGSTVQKTFTLTVNACPTLFTVDDTGDTPDANPGDGVCGDLDFICTLRAAIEEANAITACSPLTIDFSVTGTITLTDGQLPISHPNLTINGPGASQLTVTGDNTSRVFQINSTSTTNISGLTITGGNGIGASDSGSGGGILSRGKLTLTGCVVTGNTTTGMTVHEGGGIFNAGSQLLTLTDCTISNNTANFGGAGVASFANLTMTGCTVANNTNTFTSDSGRGGGIETYAATTITNSTITGNHIDNGTGDNAGGIWNCCGPMTIINSTITGNSAAGNSGAPSAGGVLQDACCGGSVTVLNSIIAGNTGTGGAVADVGGAFTSNGFNLIGNGTGSTGFTGMGDQVGTTATPINALLSLLGNFGGLTQTHALLPGSPAINAGTAGGAPTSDQRGSSRFGATDIGAFESQGFTLAIGSGSPQSAVVNTAFGLPLKVNVTANTASEPVNGGTVTFAPPGSGASATVAGSPVTISSGMATTGTVTANSITGSYNVAAGATGATGINFALTNTCQTITVTNPGANTSTVNSFFTATFTQTGGIGMTTFSTTSTLPNGVTLSSGGVLSGTPTQSGSFPITVTATDSNNCMGASVGYTLTVNCQTITVTNPAIMMGAAGEMFSQTFTQSGAIGGATFSLNSGTLPTGLSVSGAGVLNGTPTQTGLFPITVKVTDGNGCIGVGPTYNLVINCPTITVTNPAVTTGQAGVMFSQTFTQSGGVGTTTFSLNSGTLPMGLSLSSAGVLSGTPSQIGTFPITVRATDSNNCMGIGLTYNLVITPGAATHFSVVAPLTATAGVAFSFTVTALDQYNNTATGYTGTVAFTKSDGGGGSAVPTNYTFTGGDAGVRTFTNGATMVTAGNQTITATDTVTASINGTSNNILVGAAAASTLMVSIAPSTTLATNTSFTVTARDAFGNTATTYSGTVAFTMTSGTGTATFTPPSSTLTSGAGTFQVSFSTVGMKTITATDTLNDTITGSANTNVTGLTCPSTLTVNDLGDTPDNSAGDGFCNDGTGKCTLRAAIEEANALITPVLCSPLTINFSVTGTINLGSALANLNHPNLTINGPGAGQLTVRRNSGGEYRIFTINSGRTVAINRLTIRDGMAEFGGGILNQGALTLSGVVVTNNNAGSRGGGIRTGGSLIIEGSTISNNSIDQGVGGTALGGGISGVGGTVTVTNTTFSGNGNNNPLGSIAGAAMHLQDGVATLTNCTISNHANDNNAGIIRHFAASLEVSLTMTNCTVTANKTTSPNGAIQLDGLSFRNTVQLRNTLVAGNTGLRNFEVSGLAIPLVSLGNNLDSDGSSGFTNGVNGDIVGTIGTPINALLGPLANNGGPTQTHLPLPGSPAIDKGGAGVTTDQRGQSRPFDIPGVANAAGGNGSDIGAVEVQCSAITLAGLPGGSVGVAYTPSNLAGGGTAPYTLSITGGSLPLGVTISGNGLTGTPTQLGNFSFTLTAQDAYGCTGSQSYTVSITCPTITLSPTALPAATVNAAYPQTITASPALAYNFAVTSGLLPTGLTLNANGSFSGAPTQSGTFNFRVTASFNGCSTFADYVLLVNCPTITLAPTSLPGGTLGTAYNQSLTASPAGSYFYSVTSGALPTGLMLNGATGAITGTPTGAGTFNFTITAAAGACSASRSYTVTIVCQSVSIISTTTLTATAGSAYSHAISVTPAGNYTFVLTQGNLPSGLTLNPLTGIISGLPTVVGTVSFKVGVQLPNSCVSEQTYTMNVVCPTVVTVLPTTLPNGTTGTAYNQTLSASPAGGNYVYTVSAGSLPTGLNLNPATGVLSGTPSANGSFSFTITATGFGSCSGNRGYTIVIGSGGCQTISLPASLPGGSVGQLYSNSVAASPAGSYSYTSTGTLPPGVSLYSSFGLLLGYPTTNGTFNFSVTATDANNCSATQSYSVVIGAGNSQATVNDFSGDRRSDFALWREAQTQWLIVDGATGAAQIAQWGQAGDRPVAGDFDGDGKADLAGFGKDGRWRVKLSGGGTVDKVWGLGSDTPVAGDFDGDGKTDLAVWRGAETTWYILRSSDGQTQTTAWGSSLAPYSDLAVPGDYDGDGKTDIAVFRQANGHWYIRRSSDGKVVDKAWGLGTDVPVQADFDGDGKTDIAVWRGSESHWYIINSSTGATETKFWGAGYAPYFDVPAVGDYDGDGKADAAVWRKSDNRWYVLQSSDGAARSVTQGRAGDAPVVAQPRP